MLSVKKQKATRYNLNRSFCSPVENFPANEYVNKFFCDLLFSSHVIMCV